MTKRWIFLWVGREGYQKDDEKRFHVGKGYKSEHEAKVALNMYLLQDRDQLDFLWDVYNDIGQKKFCLQYNLNFSDTEEPESFEHFETLYLDQLANNVELIPQFYDSSYEIAEVIRV